MNGSGIDAAAKALLGEFTADDSTGVDPVVQKALFLASELQKRAHVLQTPEERKQQTELDRMIQNPTDKVTLTALTDQAFRSEAAARSADQLVHILDVQGIPRFFSPMERTLLMGFQSFGSYVPGVTIPMVKDKMRRETANVIIPAERDVLSKHLRERRDEGVRMNVNFLGEAILGEEEANRRLKQYLQAFQLPEVEVMSVKISTIYSQISPIARQACIDPLCDRMELLYRAAAKGTFERKDGSIVPKFVYMDMEEYRDLSLTAEVFMKTLDRPGLNAMAAGIVLQAYIPDSHAWQRTLTEWARQRVKQGGAPVTIRIVKGANMEMERVEASLQGWPQAPFQSKLDTDANYKRMVDFALRPENLAAVRPGIASHNLFDISYALVLATEADALGKLQFEMLEGMANHQRRALHELTNSVLLYAPACQKEDFIHAIGYLVRRLDENTGEENFLRHAFNITVESDAWKLLEAGFLASFDRINKLPLEPRRLQDRRHRSVDSPSSEAIAAAAADTECVSREKPRGELIEVTAGTAGHEFVNEPDTDFSLPANSLWADQIVTDWVNKCDDQAAKVSLRVGGEIVIGQRVVRDSLDPSRDGTVVARYVEANGEDVAAAVVVADQDPAGWRALSSDERREVLARVADEVRLARDSLMGAALAEGGKTLLESDPEVSEAVDFIEFYSQSAVSLDQLKGVTARGRGVVVVVSPWNFPIAIPCGGIAAALAAGNCVILKPASNTVLIASLLCECFYRGGVPREALQMMPCPGSQVGESLVTNELVDTVILTGGTDTALNMLHAKPEMRLLAETGGKNATIVTAMADRDQAIKHVLQSAFGHSGQKCSATSLLLLEEEVFQDEAFRATLVDAAKSLKVGSAWDTSNRMGPMIAPPAGDLNQALKELETGESWALMPRRLDGHQCVYSPGIKWNVQRGSYTHLTEFFGPVLGVMSFRSLSEAIQIVNETGYGLTSGLESLDDREQSQWLAGIRAGNLYLNRSTTGAIVLRQPFGGMGRSAFGPGIKAGGPNYVAQLMKLDACTAAPQPQVSGPVTSKPSMDEDATQPSEDATQGNHGQLSDLATALVEHSSDGGKVEQQEVRILCQAITSYQRAAADEFLQTHDHFRLVGQDNLRRYVPMPVLVIRVSENDTWSEIVMRVAAAKAVACRSIVSAPEGVHSRNLKRLHDMTESWAADIEFVEQTTEELIDAVEWGGVSRLRYAAPDRVPMAVRRAVMDRYVHVADTPVCAEGRIELMWYVQEQSISSDYHRYGNLGLRADEERAAVL
jgi:RHH-type proline utilization regulon transcriptional repressor/proline dehydrogenase/delta 1-pyrroline-5-carboxylate dehydrogenase